MAKLTPNFQFLPISGDAVLTKFSRMLQQLWQNLSFIVNGQIGFGDGINSDNINGVWVTVTFVTPNVDQTATHNLGRIPVGYIPMAKNAACDVYTGSVPATLSQITLRGTTASTVVLFIC